MVKLKIKFFKYLDFLDKVSDKCCEGYGKKYIDFDKIEPNLASVDCLIIEEIKNYIVLIEFKNLNDLNQNEIEKWINNKEKIQQILLKGYESYFVLRNICRDLAIIKKFNQIEKRFILVYKANFSKNKIKEHFKRKLKRLEITFDNVLILECKNFLNLLKRIDNVF